jgi:excisionase family DNA binding protein
LKNVSRIGVHQVAAPEQVAFSPATAAQFANCSTNKIYTAIRAKELLARKLGRKTLILRDDLLAWLKSLPLKTGPSDAHRARALERWAAHKSSTQSAIQEQLP